MEEKMGPRIREDKKWGRFFTPHPFDKLRAGSSLPPSVGGREGGVGLTVGEDGKILA